MSRPEPSLYDRVGGEADFVALVDRFSERVERDPVRRRGAGRARRRGGDDAREPARL